MSNELAFMQDANLPAHLRQQTAGHTEFDDMGGAIIPRVKVRVTGIQIIEGEEVLAEVPAGNSIPLVMVGASPVSRSYYKNNYTQGESSMPDCRSYDGVSPDAGVPSPQSNKCDTCPMNAKGSSKESAGAKACRYRQNLAVISPAMPDKLLRLPISATSIFPKDDYDSYSAFRPFVAKLRNNKLQPFHVITDVRQNPRSEQTHTVFKPVGYVDEAVLAQVMKHRENQDALDVIYGKFEQSSSSRESAEEEARKDAEAFEALHGAVPSHIAESAVETTTKQESGNSTSTQAVKTNEAMLGYTPYEPHEFADDVTYWQGITVTRQLGSESVNVVIKLETTDPLPDEEWDEVDAQTHEEYLARVKAYEDSLNTTKPPRRRGKVVEEATTQEDTSAPPRRQRKATETTSQGEEAGATQTTNRSALVEMLDNAFDDEE